MDDKEKEKQKRIKLANHLHPHDDEPDPTAYMGNYNFLRCYLLSALGLLPCLYYQSTKSTISRDVHSQSIFKTRLKDENRYHWFRSNG